MSTSQITNPSGSDLGYEAILTKLVALIALRHTWDFTLVTAAMSPYTVLPTDQELVVDSPSNNVMMVIPAVASSEGRRIRISVHSLAGHTVSTSTADSSAVNGGVGFSHSGYTSKEFACLNGKWLAY